MDIRLSHKIIKEMCGTVSFKRGDAFYQAGKVHFDTYTPYLCEAIVKGAEEFQVTIKKKPNGSMDTVCSCPSLASVKHDCQHIAAVLLAILAEQQSGPQHELTKNLITLFQDQLLRKSGEQLHFESRQVLPVELMCKLVWTEKERYQMEIEMNVSSNPVEDIRDFLQRVHAHSAYKLSHSLTYDPNVHCFQKETDAILQQLIQLALDEKMFGADSRKGGPSLLIPPSSWDRILPLLMKAPFVKLEGAGDLGRSLSKEKLPLTFHFSERPNQGFQLKIDGLHDVKVMADYHLVLSGKSLHQMKEDDCRRLAELQHMLTLTGTEAIPIAYDQMEFFLEKVVPGLRRLGQVEMADAITQRLMKTPLVAKLYLDRVKNRLLAGLEFQYEQIVINPLESRDLPGNVMLIRDVEKEAAILQLMDESSFGKTDGGYFLQNEELEYEFLHSVVPKLQKLVQIYATTAVRNRIFRENAHPQIRVRVKKERTNWLEFTFEMNIPEQQIRDILQALEEKRKYYRLRSGSLLSLETREFEEIRRFLEAAPVVQYEDLESGLHVPIVQGLRLLDSSENSSTFQLEESFRQFLEQIHQPASLAIDVPYRLQPILREYQVTGYKWMKTLASYGFGGILADDMGLGKTLQSLTFILSELGKIREHQQPVLIVCPSSLTYNWLHECMKFAPELEAVVVDGNQSERIAVQKAALNMDVVITSYPLLRRDIHWYEKQNFHTVFFDEAQAFKNPITQTARAVKKLKAAHRFALTGTPVENSLEELWSIFHVVFPELLMGLREFSHLSRKTIARRIRPFLLRRLKEEVLAELPRKIEILQTQELLPEQKKLYAAYLAKLRHDALKHLNKDTLRKNRIRILAGLTRLRQICCHPALFVDGYHGSSAKFEQLKELLEESMQEGRRVLIFSQFTKMLTLIGRELAKQGWPYFYLDGQTPSEERVELCNRFNAGERNLFLISLKAGGTGLNLTGADTVILYDVWWNPAVEEQAADRAHRMGQTSSVQVIKLIARGTIEEKMNDLQEKKRHLVEEIIGSANSAASGLTDEDIREILEI